MYRYSALAMEIESELKLPELSPSSRKPEVFIRFGKVAGADRKFTLEEEVANHAGLAAFQIRHGCEIVVDPIPGAAPVLLRVVLLGKVMAFLQRQRGWLPLHASTVIVDGKGILFLGDSGAGKSSTAAAFHAHGHTVLGDDLGAVKISGGECFVLGRMCAYSMRPRKCGVRQAFRERCRPTSTALRCPAKDRERRSGCTESMHFKITSDSQWSRSHRRVRRPCSIATVSSRDGGWIAPSSNGN